MTSGPHPGSFKSMDDQGVRFPGEKREREALEDDRQLVDSKVTS